MSRDVEAMHLLWRAVRNDLAPAQLGAFRTSGALPVPAAIALYKNAYWIRQHDALRDLFPRLEARLGAARFRELVRRYLRAQPSTHPELERLGTALPGFLEAETAEEFSALASLAAYEHALIDSFLAPDTTTLASVADINPHTFATARLGFVPHLQIVPVDAALARELAAEGQDVIGAVAAIVARPKLGTATHLVGRVELELLELAREGTTIGELLGRCDHDVSGLHVHVTSWFRRAWIAAIHEDPSC